MERYLKLVNPPQIKLDPKLVQSLPADLQSIFDSFENSSVDISFEEHFYNSGGQVEDYDLLVALAGDVGASPKHISVKWENKGYDLLSYGSDDHKFESSFFDLIYTHIYLPVKGNVQLNTPVAKINYQQENVQVTDVNSTVYNADHVIVTVPVSILKAKEITFMPELPSYKTQSFRQLGMEAGIKAFMRFSVKFTDKNILGGNVCASYVVESDSRESDDLILFGFVIGDQAKALSEMGESAGLKALLQELDLMFEGQASASFVDHFFKDWYKEPYIKGAYSYPLVGANENTRKNCARSVDNKLFFAGEATNYNGHHQTVHGAVESAYREVIHLIGFKK